MFKQRLKKGPDIAKGDFQINCSKFSRYLILGWSLYIYFYICTGNRSGLYISAEISRFKVNVCLKIYKGKAKSIEVLYLFPVY